MLTMPLTVIRTRATRLVELCARAGIDAQIEDGASAVGGGASPDAVVPTALVTIAGNAEALLRRLRGGDPIVIARIVNDRVAIDLRTVAFSSDDDVAHAVIGAHK
jgi:L-seryl-tRNA(Ser) seleniumtransferase